MNNKVQVNLDLNLIFKEKYYQNLINKEDKILTEKEKEDILQKNLFLLFNSFIESFNSYTSSVQSCDLDEITLNTNYTEEDMYKDIKGLYLYIENDNYNSNTLKNNKGFFILRVNKNAKTFEKKFSIIQSSYSYMLENNVLKDITRKKSVFFFPKTKDKELINSINNENLNYIDDEKIIDLKNNKGMKPYNINFKNFNLMKIKIGKKIFNDETGSVYKAKIEDTDCSKELLTYFIKNFMPVSFIFHRFFSYVPHFLFSKNTLQKRFFNPTIKTEEERKSFDNDKLDLIEKFKLIRDTEIKGFLLNSVNYKNLSKDELFSILFILIQNYLIDITCNNDFIYLENNMTIEQYKESIFGKNAFNSEELLLLINKIKDTKKVSLKDFITIMQRFLKYNVYSSSKNRLRCNILDFRVQFNFQNELNINFMNNGLNTLLIRQLQLLEKEPKLVNMEFLNSYFKLFKIFGFENCTVLPIDNESNINYDSILLSVFSFEGFYSVHWKDIKFINKNNYRQIKDLLIFYLSNNLISISMEEKIDFICKYIDIEYFNKDIGKKFYNKFIEDFLLSIENSSYITRRSLFKIQRDLSIKINGENQDIRSYFYINSEKYPKISKVILEYSLKKELFGYNFQR